MNLWELRKLLKLPALQLSILDAVVGLRAQYAATLDVDFVEMFIDGPWG
jgi:hypothetical protein